MKVNSDPALQSLWQRDVPPTSDMTFVLTALQRIEQRRFRLNLLAVLFAAVVSAVMLWLLWPVLVEWSMLLLEVLQSATQLEVLAVSLLVAVIVYTETRVFR